MPSQQRLARNNQLQCVDIPSKLVHGALRVDWLGVEVVLLLRRGVFSLLFLSPMIQAGRLNSTLMGQFIGNVWRRDEE